MLRRARKSTKSVRVVWNKAPDIQKRVEYLVQKLEFNWLNSSDIHCIRSQNSRARAYARIWGMGRIWQEAIGISPKYCIEVLSENYDKLPNHEKDKVLLHELAHIPKNFSGSLLPHTRKRKGSFHDKLKTMIAQYDEIGP